jgi:hypothetical protein
VFSFRAPEKLWTVFVRHFTRRAFSNYPVPLCGFTLPDSINVLAMQDPRWFMICYLGQLGNFESLEKPIQTGMIAVYTWGQNLSLHPHLLHRTGRRVDKNSGRI